MIKKLVKHGNSYALIIDKPILDLLKITPDTPLEITTDGKRILAGPPEEFVGKDHPEQLESFLEDVNRRYGDVLKRLA